MIKYKLIRGRDYSKYYKVEKDENGKPYLINSDKYISVSHQGNWTLIAISDLPVGIDVERIRKYKESLPKYLGLDNGKKISKYTLFKEWTRREAYIKKNNLKLNQIGLLNGNMDGKFKTFLFYPYVISVSY